MDGVYRREEGCRSATVTGGGVARCRCAEAGRAARRPHGRDHSAHGGGDLRGAVRRGRRLPGALQGVAGARDCGHHRPCQRRQARRSGCGFREGVLRPIAAAAAAAAAGAAAGAVAGAAAAAAAAAAAGAGAARRANSDQGAPQTKEVWVV
ncbi:unnamed protein product [Laminaria digitata]